jgi:hypothetical protein
MMNLFHLEMKEIETAINLDVLFFAVDLESRFGMMFKDPVTLPIPDRMTKNNKMYPSQQSEYLT